MTAAPTVTESPTNNAQVIKAINARKFEHAKEILAASAHAAKEVDELGSTPLHAACARSNLELVKLLVKDYDVDVHAATKDGTQAIHEASAQGFVQGVKHLVEHCNADVKKGDGMGMTPLHHACWKGSLELVKYITTKCKVNVNAMTLEDKLTPLHFAVMRGNMDVIQHLVEKAKANPRGASSVCHSEITHNTIPLFRTLDVTWRECVGLHAILQKLMLSHRLVAHFQDAKPPVDYAFEHNQKNAVDYLDLVARRK
eukprot:GFYU01021888.1.p1 GENE.GFYU01021888.1~~GFYU01021888.1.p1  ORF type:complete len:256 (-),score=38.33 GFYU01021888.1:75-842(-)